MGKVSESIFSDGNVIIPMADVQHAEYKKDEDGLLIGGCVITKHTKWDFENDYWANNIWLTNKQMKSFLKAWCYYRYELEKGFIKERKYQPTPTTINDHGEE